MIEYLAKNYDHSQNGEGYEYTFFEFGSTGYLACRQMEGVMEELTKAMNLVEILAN